MTIWCLTWWWCYICLWSGQYRVVETGEWFWGNGETERKWEGIKRARGRKEKKSALSGSSNPSSGSLFPLSRSESWEGCRIWISLLLPCPSLPLSAPQIFSCPAHKKRLPRPFLLNNLQLCTNTFHLGMQKTIKACAVKETQRQMCEGSYPGCRL